MTKLKDIDSIPFFYDYEFQNNSNIIIENLLKTSLKDILNFIECGFDISTISIIVIQVINILQKMYNRNIIHNDLKPNNIYWSKFINEKFEEQQKFFLVDFGYARDITECISKKKPILIANSNISTKIRIHYKDKYENKLQGTPQFIVIKVCEGFRPSIRTDLEELIYTLIYLNK